MNISEDTKKKIKEKALCMAFSDYFCNVNDEGWPDDPIDFLQRANSDYYSSDITISGDEPNYDDPEAKYMTVCQFADGMDPLQLLEIVQDRAYSIETNFYNLLINIEKAE